MRTVNFKSDTINGVAHLLGIDPEQDLLRDHARAWVASINSAVRFAWAFWQWSEFEVTEERAFRQIYYGDVIYSANSGEDSEVYFLDTEKYYRVIGSPPIATAPTNLAYWEEITDLDYHIAYHQYGKEAIDRFISIDNVSPRTSLSALAWKMSPSGYGIDVSRIAGPTVWVTYIPRSPKFATDLYSDTATYARGDVVLDLASGTCYRALTANTAIALSNVDRWRIQPMPYVISEYVKYATAAEQCDDLQSRAVFQDMADKKLYGEIDKLMAQGQTFFYSPSRQTRIPLGLSGYMEAYWRVA